MRRKLLLRLATVAALVAPLPVAAQLRVVGDVPQPTTLTADDIRALPHVNARAAEHGQPPVQEYSGVPLAAVLARAGVTLGASLRGPRLAGVLLVEASHGYRVAFALPELDSAFTSRVVLLVDRMNGQPLPPDAGPFRVVVPDEKRPARWVR